jgi:hypothetical protein
MRRAEMMTAGAVTLAGLGAIVALAIGSGDAGQKLAAQRIPPVEVRTEVIRRTVNVYRHQRTNGAGVGAGSSGGAPWRSGAAASSATTRSSGAPRAAPSAPVVATRSSGASRTPAPSTSQARPVGTRSSGASRPSGSSSSPARSVTRASGGGSSGAGPSHPVSTRSSGGGGERDGGGRDD